VHGATLESFSDEPWPTWTYRLADGSRIEQELFVAARPRGSGAPLAAGGRRDEALPFAVRPFLSGRDSHALHHENPSFRFTEQRQGSGWSGIPMMACRRCTRSPTAATGRSAVVPRVPLHGGAGARAGRHGGPGGAGRVPVGPLRGRRRAASGRRRGAPDDSDATEAFARLRRSERARGRGSRRGWSARGMPIWRGAIRERRSSPAIPGSRTGAVTRSSPQGTLVSRPAVCPDARSILLEWADLVSEGCCQPVRRSGRCPEYNTVAHRCGMSSPCTSISRPPRLRAARHSARPQALGEAVQAILAGHVRGTRYGIRPRRTAFSRRRARGSDHVDGCQGRRMGG